MISIPSNPTIWTPKEKRVRRFSAMSAGGGARGFSMGAGGAVSTGWNPSRFSKCFFWLRADRGVQASSRVDSWTCALDASDPGRIFTETGNNRPLRINSDRYNGQAVLIDGRLRSWQGFANGSSSQPNELFVVGHVPTGATKDIVDGYDGTTNRNYIRSSASDTWQCGTNSTITSTASSTTPSILSLLFNGASSALYVNDHATANLTGNTGAAFSAQSMSILCFTNSGTISSSAGIGSSIAEVAYFDDALTTHERYLLFKYASERYGLPFS